MSFRITITVPDNKLVSTLRSLNGFKYEVEHVEDVKRIAGPKAKSNGRITGETLLSLGGKEATPDTNYAVIQKTLKKLEVRHGPHSVTRAQLRDELLKNDDIADWVCTTGIVEAVKSGYLEVG